MSQIEQEISDSGYKITWKPSYLNKDAFLYWLDEQIKILEIREAFNDKNTNLKPTLECYRFLEQTIKEGGFDVD